MQKNLRILITNYRGNPHCGGQGIYIRYLSRALHALGHDVTVISGQPWPILDEGVHFIPLPTLNLADEPSKLRAFKVQWLFNAIDRYEFFSALSGGFPDPLCFARRFKIWLDQALHDNTHCYDIIHDNQTLAYPFVELQKYIPLVTTLHHPIVMDRDLQLQETQHFFLKLLVRRWYSFLTMQKDVCPQLDYLTCPSNSAKTDSAKLLNVRPETATVIPLAVDTEAFHPIPEIKREEYSIISTVSADAPLKGMQYLLRATALLAPKYPNLKVRIAGEPKEDSPSAKLVKELALEDKVEFFKGISTRALCELYAKSSVAVIPSLYEGFSLPAIESMACEVPVVATDVGSLPEVTQQAAILVLPKDPQAIADAVTTLFESKDKRASLVVKGRELVDTQYNWHAVASRYVKLYQQAIAKQGEE